MSTTPQKKMIEKELTSQADHLLEQEVTPTDSEHLLELCQEPTTPLSIRLACYAALKRRGKVIPRPLVKNLVSLIIEKIDLLRGTWVHSYYNQDEGEYFRYWSDYGHPELNEVLTQVPKSLALRVCKVIPETKDQTLPFWSYPLLMPVVAFVGLVSTVFLWAFSFVISVILDPQPSPGTSPEIRKIIVIIGVIGGIAMTLIELLVLFYQAWKDRRWWEDKGWGWGAETSWYNFTKHLVRGLLREPRASALYWDGSRVGR